MRKKHTYHADKSFTLSIALFVLHALFLSAYCSFLSAEQNTVADEIIRKQKYIKTISAEFVQEKHSTMASEPIFWEGEFYFMAPTKVAWLYDRQVKIVSDGENLTLYYPELKMAEIVPVQQNKIQLPLNFTLDELRRHFRFSIEKKKSLSHVTLTPLDDASLLVKMIITLTDKAVPQTVEIFEKGGDRSLIRFRNQHINKELSNKHFTLHLPQDTTIRKSP